MATDRLINQSQGDDIINALDDIATGVGNISYGEQTSSDKVVAMTGYQKASTAEAITQADTLNEAVGKLEKKVDDNATDISDKVDGPNSATVGNIATFNNVNGKSIDDSGISVETSLDNTKDTEVPTSKAVDTYITDQGFAKGVSSSTANNLVTFNGTDGKTLKDSGVAIVTTMDDTSDAEVPTSEAIGEYITDQKFAVGLDSSTANHLVTFNGTDGKTLKDSGITVAKSVTNDDTAVPTSKAVQTYAAPASHTHSESEITDLGNYAGSNEKGGAATSANKLNIGNSNIGSATQPVYFDKTTGLPVAITNTIQSNVPANAVFTDTTYQFETGTANGKIKVTPSDDTAYEVPVYGLKAGAYTETTTSVTSGSGALITSGGVHTALLDKVDKVTGKGLSSNDYTDDEKTKLSNIQAGAEVNVQADWTQTTTTADSYIKNKPTLGTAAAANTTDFATAAQGTKADNAIPSSTKGVANGVASLDSSGKVPSSQLPSYVDDVLEYSSKSSFPSSGESGKIYVDTTTNKTYRWGGSAYVEISESLALGDTASTAYYGDKGKTAYDHATDSSRVTSATASGLYKVAATAQGHIASLSQVTKADITNLGIPGTDTNTHRPIKVNSTQLLGDNTTALDIVAGGNVTLTPDTSTGKVTIAATDTNTHRPIQVNGTEILGNNTTVLNLKQGSNVSITNSSGTVTIAATDTNTYVSGAAFADNTSTDANNPLKLTLSRSGSVTTAVTGTLPKVSSSSAGVVPKGAAVSSQSQSTKFLREDGTWAAPSYTTNTNTTYSFASGTTNGAFSVTPSGGSAQLVSIYGLKSAAYTESSAYATSGHTHDISITADSGTESIALAANSKYKLTAGGKSYVFKTPPDNNSVTGVKGNSESSYRTGQVNITAANIGLGNVGNFKAVSTVASQGLSDTEKSNARANIGAGTSSLGLGTSSSTAYRGDYGNSAYSHATDSSRLTTATSSGLYKVASTAQGHIASLTAVAKSDITALGIPAQDTTYGVVSTSANGLAPKVTDTSKFLKGDGTWATPTNTWTAMVGATSSANGSVGYVNATPPKDGYNTKYLRADGSWQVPPNTTYSAATQSANGLMSSTDKTKLDGIATGATAVSESTVSGWGFTKNTGTYSKPSTGIPKTDLASAVQTSLGKADSALQSHQTIKQDGVTGATIKRYGQCNTAAGTAAKTVSIKNGTFTLEEGARVSVFFTYTNTANSPTLNVNSTGAKNIYSRRELIKSANNNTSILKGIVDFVYDGTSWNLVGNYIDTDTHRAIQVNGSTKLIGSNSTALNFVGTGHVNVQYDSSNPGTITFYEENWLTFMDVWLTLTDLTWTSSTGSPGIYYSSNVPIYRTGTTPAFTYILGATIMDFNAVPSTFMTIGISGSSAVWLYSNTNNFQSYTQLQIRVFGLIAFGEA